MRALGLDLGQKRVGVAISDSAGTSRMFEVRIAADKDHASVVTVDGKELGRLETARKDGWQELALNLPDELEGDFELGMTPDGQDATTFHVWVVAR